MASLSVSAWIRDRKQRRAVPVPAAALGRAAWVLARPDVGVAERHAAVAGQVPRNAWWTLRVPNVFRRMGTVEPYLRIDMYIYIYTYVLYIVIILLTILTMIVNSSNYKRHLSYYI